VEQHTAGKWACLLTPAARAKRPQVAALWDELHTRLPWRNAVDGGKPIQPFPAAEEEERRRRRAANETDLVLFIGVNTVGGPAGGLGSCQKACSRLWTGTPLGQRRGRHPPPPA
jgi:hypothetical protein